jgi:hypothetical protein
MMSGDRETQRPSRDRETPMVRPTRVGVCKRAQGRAWISTANPGPSSYTEGSASTPGKIFLRDVEICGTKRNV